VFKLLTHPLKSRAAVALACFAAIVGLLSISSVAQALVGIWRTDDLKSMGLVVPFVCAALVLRAWRQIGWRAEGAWWGSWWGFALLAGAAALVYLRDQTLLIVTVNKDWLLQIPPLPLVAVVYAAGIVLLFGGKPLLKAAWFPVLLMWAVIPVPQTFSRRIDLPLQHASATVARAFAHALGQPLTQDKLRLMFTPQFGMFIAPGCNGIRGAITLGLAAIVVGYIYRFRWFVFAPVVAGAVLLGYLFNFLRLCLLVVYYKLALPYPWMQHHAKIADYVIGGCLFVCALAVFFWVANKLRREPEDVLPAPALQHEAPSVAAGPYLLRVAAVVALAAIFGTGAVHSYFAEPPATSTKIAAMPQQIGSYTLVRSWNDTLLDGIVVYTWGEYVNSADPAAAHVALGISPQLGVHDVEVCHIARGEDPTWHGQMQANTAGGTVDLTMATYNDGSSQKLEASSVCDAGACRQFSETSSHVTLVYAHPHRTMPLGAETTRPVPILLKVDGGDPTEPANSAEPKLAASLQQFLAQADLVKLTAPYSRP
jgi:exosortase J